MLSNQFKKIENHEAIEAQDLHGRLRVAYFDVDFSSSASAGSNIDITKLPAGNLRILKVGLVDGSSASNFDVGMRENVDLDGTIIAENHQAIIQDLAEGEEKLLNCRLLTKHMPVITLTNKASVSKGQATCGYITYVVD